MNKISVLFVAAAAGIFVTHPAPAQGLLGDVLGTVGGVVDSTGLGETIGSVVGTNQPSGVVDLSGNSGNLIDLSSNGPVVNLPGSIGVPDVAEVHVQTGGSTRVDVEVLGGGGGSLGLPLDSLLGGNSGIGISLPGGGGGGGTPGTPGAPGAPGLPGLPGVNGTPGATGVATINRTFGGGGGGGISITTNSSRLRTLLGILEARHYLRFAAGRGVCLPAFGVANVGAWIPQRDHGQLQRVLQAYSGDIQQLRRLLANCSANRGLISRADMDRVIGVDIRRDGTTVLFLL